MWQGILTVVVAMGLGTLSMAVDAGPGNESSCVDCHRNTPKDTFVGSKFLDWEESIHARERIACQRCHGGDPSASGREEAHVGVYNSSNPKSKVYYKNVPGTCGACHRRDYNAFTRSEHYTFLERTGAGPTCVTCHGSHVTHIISAGQVPTVCTQCHNERMRINPQVPTQAQAVLLLINETTLLVEQARKQVKEGDEEGMRAWKLAYTMTEKARDDWHAFDLKEVQRTILTTYDMLTPFLRQNK